MVDEVIHFEKTKEAAQELWRYIEKAYKYMGWEITTDLTLEQFGVSVGIPQEDIVIDIDYRKVEVDGVVKSKEDSICYDIQIVKHYSGGQYEPPSEELEEHSTTYRLLDTVAVVLDISSKMRLSGVMESLELEYYEL